MTARLHRLAGAVVVAAGGRYFLVGNTKRPCDFAAAGFRAPGELDAVTRPVVPLEAQGDVALSGPSLLVEDDGAPEALAAKVAALFLIARNGSVSERLWSLVLAPDPGGAVADDAVVDARWLTQTPSPIWGIVRDAVLRCT